MDNTELTSGTAPYGGPAAISAGIPNGEWGQQTAPENLVTSLTPSVENLVMPPTPLREELVTSPTPPAENLVTSPTPPAENLVTFPTPPAENLVTSPTPPAENLVTSPTPPAENLVTSPTSPAENLVTSPTPPAENLVTSPTSPAENLVMPPTAPAADLMPGTDPFRDMQFLGVTSDDRGLYLPAYSLDADNSSGPEDGGEMLGMLPLTRDLGYEGCPQVMRETSFQKRPAQDHPPWRPSSGVDSEKDSSLLLTYRGLEDKAQEEDGSKWVGKGVSEPVVEKKESGMTPVRQLLSLWYAAVILLTPLILLPLPLVVNTPEAKCAYVIFVMAVFWVTEAIPIPVTSLMPIFLLPMMGLLTARQTSASYINDTSMLFMGGLTVAIAIERWNLHRRIALAVMMVVGAEPRWLMLGMMLVTWFLSMWISNTATTAMMLPIVQAVLQQISSADDTQPNGSPLGPSLSDDEDIFIGGAQEAGSKQNSKKGDKGKHQSRTDRTVPGDDRKKKKKASAGKQLSMKKLGKALSLAVAYSANVGGIGSLTGTGPNLVLLGQSQIIFEKVGLTTPITFAKWLVYGLPLSFILVIVIWLWLQTIFLRCGCGCECILRRGSGGKEDSSKKKVRTTIRAEFRKLGPISFAEGTVMVCFALLVVLWITRDLGGSVGWGNIFQDGFVSDTTPAILIAVLLFVLPSSLPDLFFRSRRQGGKARKALPALLNWQVMREKMPWSLYLLLGGGFAIARAAQDSGLSLWLGQKLSVFGALDPWLMLLIICYIVTFVTEVTSNTAIATLMMPILAQLSLTLDLNPLFFMFPVAITTSFAFMLPVATPPNAIVFAFGTVRVIDMVTCGIILNILSVPFLLLATVTWGNAFFHFDVLPAAFFTNGTTLPSNSSTL